MPAPGSRHGDKVVPVFLPVMKRFGIEVSTVRPLDRSERLVQFNSVEERQILQWPEHLAFEDGP